MSRIADAYRKARSLNRLSTETPAPVLETWLSRDLPWDLTESSRPVPDRVLFEPATQVGPGTGQLLVAAPPAWREQLVPLIERITRPASAGDHARSLLFVSVDTDPRDQAVCAAAAGALAYRTAGSICIVDANLRSSTGGRSVAQDSGAGFSDSLLDGADVRRLLSKVSSNTWLMPAGTRAAEAIPHLAERCAAPLAQLCSLFDYVLVDTAAASDDAIVIGRCLDGVVLVIDADRTRREVAQRAAERLQTAHVRIYGAVLTNRSFPIPGALYRRL